MYNSPSLGLLAIWVSAFAVAPMVMTAADVKEAASPDKRYLAKVDADTNESTVRFRVIDLKTKKTALDFKEDGVVGAAESFALWSADGTRVAFYRNPKRGGYSTAYAADGKDFKELVVPEINVPAEKDSHQAAGRWVYGDAKPIRWTKNGGLAVKCSGLFQVRREEKWVEYSYDVLVTFDPSGKGSVAACKRTELKTR